MSNPFGRAALLALAAASVMLPPSAGAQTRGPAFTIEQILKPAFPYDLTSARRADRFAWVEYERGWRNVYTAAAPDFRAMRLTSTTADDGVDVGPLTLSDDGSVVLFVRGHPPDQDGIVVSPASDPLGGRREIWAASTSGNRQPWRVAALRESGRGGGGGGGGSPMVLSPDGRWVLYVGDGRIYRAEVDPGIKDAATVDAAPPLLRDFGVHSDPVWSPDGKRIAFMSSRFDQRRPFPLQGRAATHSFITVYDVDRRRITYMAPSVDRDTSPVWSPDGRSIAYLRRPGLPFGAFATPPRDLPAERVPAGFIEAKFQGGYTLAIWVADVETGKARELWHTAPGEARFEDVQDIRWSGDHIVFQAEPDNWIHMYSVSVANPQPAPVDLTPGDAEVEHVALSADGRWLYFTSNLGDLERRELWRVAVGGGRAEQLTRGPALEFFPAISGTGGHVALLQSGWNEPLTVAVLPAAGGSARKIGTPLPADFPTARHVEPQIVETVAADGVRSRHTLFLPPDLRPGERRPALMFIHGGPAEQMLPGYHYHDGSRGFYHMVYGMQQYFANKGYVVMSVNYRAGTNYGKAYREALEGRDRGNSEYRDILAAGQYLHDRPDVDPERLGVWGLSYGGWLTGQALSRNSELFKAGMIFAGVQMRSASMDPSNLAYQSSPAYNIDKWTSPVLIVHGDDDRNVEFSQTVGLVQALRAYNVPHEVIVNPNDTHYSQLYSRWVEAWPAIDEWFDRTLLKGKGAGPTRSQQR
ncbi:MAG: S9 family peptidase [Gemmatimonadetes bacterium]|nr:S9 family peptidase [Gemmatimonadota bacterium]